MSLNRAQRRQAAKEFQAQLKTGAVRMRPDSVPDLAELANRPKAVTLGYVADQYVTVEFHRSVMATAARSSQFGFAIRPRDVQATVERPKALNLLLKSFCDTEDDFLLFADTNIAFAPQDVAMLIAADAPIAGALYFSAALGQESWPTAWVELAEPDFELGDQPLYGPVTLPTPPEDFDESNQEQLEAWMAELSLPIPVAAVGAGLLLVRRDCAETMVADYDWPFEAVMDRREDLVFGLRAAAAGFDSVVMPAARVGYITAAMH